ncbi:hypothetical protein CAEBREN_13052, partial [Caenorhabditis brenneri]
RFYENTFFVTSSSLLFLSIFLPPPKNNTYILDERIRRRRTSSQCHVHSKKGMGLSVGFLLSKKKGGRENEKCIGA